MSTNATPAMLHVSAWTIRGVDLFDYDVSAWQFFNPSGPELPALRLASTTIAETAVSLGVKFLFALLVTLSIVAVCVKKRGRLPPELPWVGRKPGVWFAETRAWFGSYGNTRRWLAEGYEKYSRHGVTFVLPDFSGKPIVMVPHDRWKWFVDRTDKVTSFEAAIFDLVVGDYNFPDPEVLRHFYCTRVAHRFIRETLPNLAAPTYDEISRLFSEIWGEDTHSWKTLNVHKNVQRIILGVACRVIVGPELSKHEGFLDAVAAHEDDVVRVAFLDPYIPKWLRPVVGAYILGLPNWWHFRRIRGLIMPLIKQRLSEQSQGGIRKSELAQDYITWHIKTSIADRKDAELDPEWIAKSFLPILFGTVHGTQATLVNLLLNLLSSKQDVIDALRDEVEHVYRNTETLGDRSFLSCLSRMDSAIRESMRLDGLTAHVLYRKVVSKAGLLSPDGSWTLPFGTTIAVDAWTRHRDAAIYAEPDHYDALRFSRQQEDHESPGRNGEASSNIASKVSIACVSDTFLAFGLGRHACPGRSWVDIALKMFLVHMLRNYDVQQLHERPPNSTHGPYSVPNENTTIQIRRRSANTGGPSAKVAT